jgi:hypothetical protein
VSAIAVTNALARHFSERVTGTKEAYATGTTGQESPGLPADIFDTPVVLTMYRRTNVVPGSFERTHWTIDALAYFSNADPAGAYLTYVTFVDDVRTSIRGNWTLFGTATQISSWNAAEPEDLEVNGKAYVRIAFTFDVLEAGPQTYTAS